MTVYFRSKIITTVSDCYKESYYFGICSENWNETDANNLVKNWINEQKNDLFKLNKGIIRTFEPAEECTASQFRKCFIKINVT